jgi:predicted dehydrogenase
MNALVIGYGSIGERHVRLLNGLGLCTSVLSRRNIESVNCYTSLQDALGDKKMEYVVICNETSAHYDSLMALENENYKGVVLIEKPLFHEPVHYCKNSPEQVFVAYNLRFHPIITRLKQLLSNERIISAQLYVGQYLPTWRTNRDYQEGYSSSQSAGGGVLRDLSHEIDYLMWLFGRWTRVAAIGGHFSHLKITSDDIFGVLVETERCPMMTLQLNYLDRVPKREIIVQTDQLSIKGDLIKGTLQINDSVENFKLDRDFTYIKQHEAILEHNYDNICDLKEGLQIVELIDAIEKSASRKAWVQNDPIMHDLC